MRKQIVTVLGILLFTTFPVMANDANLLGDWGGARSFMDSRGVTLEAVMIMDLMHNNRGGIVQDGAILGNFDLTLNIDTETAGLWQNGTFFLYALGNFKEDKFLTEIVGDFQTSSNIEADSAFKLYEAWYEHCFAGDRASFLAGLHDYNSEFDVLEHAGLFLNSSFGIGPDISQVGNGPFFGECPGCRCSCRSCFLTDWLPAFSEKSIFPGKMFCHLFPDFALELVMFSNLFSKNVFSAISGIGTGIAPHLQKYV